MADGDGPVVEVPATGETPGPSETLEVPNGSARTCGYSRCGRILRYDGRGRPPEYCADRRWPDGRTCKQLAAAERAGERAIGLDLPLEAFRAVSDRLQPVAEGLARQLVEVSEAVGQVRDGALARIAEAERAATEAIEAVRGAEAQRDQALAAQRAADDDAAQAAAAAEEAQQRAAAAQADAERRISAAWDKAADADRARGAAEATATQQAAALAVAEQHVTAAQERATQAERVATEQTEQTAAADLLAATAQAAARTSAAEVARLDQALRAMVADVDTRLGQAQAQAAVAEHRARAAEGTLAEMRAQVLVAESRAQESEAALADLRAAADRPASRVIDLNHVITAGMVTYPGLPGPEITTHLSREDSRSHYAAGTEFSIDRISMVGNTGTYLDSPYHRYADGADLSDLPLSWVADLPVVIVRVVDVPERGVTVAMLPPADRVAGAAVLLHTGWDRHWGRPSYGGPAPYLTGEAAQWLVEAGARLVGIDGVNIDDTVGADRPAHSVLLRAGVPVLEHLTGLAAVPAVGARLHAAPPRVAGFGTFPVRAYVTI